jgi:two-component sensor histidine kinase/CHASE3 domain sensor protein
VTSPSSLNTEHHALSTDANRRRRRALLAISIGFGLLLSAATVAALLGMESGRAARRLAAAWGVRYDIERVMDQVRDGETGQRGYLLTGDPRYLEPYNSAVAGYGASLDAVGRRVADYPFLADRVAALNDLTRAKFNEMAGSLALAEAGQRENAIAQVASGSGRDLMQQVRDTIAAMTAETDRTVLEASQWRAQVVGALAMSVAGLVVAAAILAVLLLRGTLGHFRLLARREASLRSLAATLEARIQRRTRALADVNQRFAAALRAANITVFTQDQGLAYTWINRDALGLPTSQDTLPGPVSGAVVRLKESAVSSGEPTRAEVRVPRDGTDHWFEMSVAAMASQDGTPDGIVGSLVEITHRKDQEARIRLLLREVTHRSKNLLAVIQAIMRQTATSSATMPDFVKHFSARLQALAGSHDLLVREDWGQVALADIIRSQLSHYSDLEGSQIVLEGGDVFVRPDAAQHIGMALHELATNAAKYGALSTSKGRVRITWTIEPATGEGSEARRPVCRLSWVESGGPEVAPPASRGFGRVVIERTVARAVDGEVSIAYAPDGVRWTLVFPPDGPEGHAA